MFDQFGAIDRRAAVDERRHAAHVFRRPHRTPGIDARPSRRTRVSACGGRAQVGEAGALQHQRPVVLREAFGQPQLARHVRALEIERLERPRADALDVPAVEELVRDRVEQLACGRRESTPAAVITVLLRCSMPSPFAYGR